MVITQSSSHKPFEREESPMQAFRLVDQPDSDLRFATVQSWQGREVVLWSNIVELFQHDGVVKYVEDNTYLVGKIVGTDLRIIKPEMIEANTEKVLQVVLDGEQSGGHDPESGIGVPPIKSTSDMPESSSCMSKPSDPEASESSSSSVFMPPSTKHYKARLSASSTLSPLAAAARMLTVLPSARPRPSSIFLHTRRQSHPQVAQGRKATSFLLPSVIPRKRVKACTERELGEVSRSTSPPSLRCDPRCRRHQTFIPLFTCPTLAPVAPKLHEQPVVPSPRVAFSSSSTTYSPSSPASVTMGFVSDDSIDDNCWISSCDGGCLRSNRESIYLLEGEPSSLPSLTSSSLSSSSFPFALSSTSLPSSFSSLTSDPFMTCLSSDKRALAFAFTMTSNGCESRVNQPLSTNHVTESSFLSSSQPSTRRSSVLMQEPTLFLDDELSPLFN